MKNDLKKTLLHVNKHVRANHYCLLFLVKHSVPTTTRSDWTRAWPAGHGWPSQSHSPEKIWFNVEIEPVLQNTCAVFISQNLGQFWKWVMSPRSGLSWEVGMFEFWNRFFNVSSKWWHDGFTRVKERCLSVTWVWNWAEWREALKSGRAALTFCPPSHSYTCI